MAYKSFLSVVVITHPSHGGGRWFDPGRKQGFIFGLKVIFPSARVVLKSALSFSTLACWSRGIVNRS